MSAGAKLAEGLTQTVLARDDVIAAYLGVDHA
jgi:ABC-type branched-subunit amino acid transport system ATPase component